MPFGQAGPKSPRLRGRIAVGVSLCHRTPSVIPVHLVIPTHLVIPAKAGIQRLSFWIPGLRSTQPGMTDGVSGLETLSEGTVGARRPGATIYETIDIY